MERICTVTFKTPTSSASCDDTIDADDGSCLRLRCGHALHAACAMAGFRQGLGCPLCRDPLNGAAAAPDDATEDTELSDDEEAALRVLDAQLTRLRGSSPSVRLARAQLNLELADYNRHCEALKVARAAALRDALTQLRRRRLGDQQRRLKRLQGAMDRVRASERDALLSLGGIGEAFVDAFFECTSHLYQARSVRQLGLDPQSRRFWMR